MAYIQFDESTLYIIRTIIPDDEQDIPLYYESPAEWHASPFMATIFRSYDTAETHLNAAYAVSGGDGEITDIVPMLGEIRKFKEKLPK